MGDVRTAALWLPSIVLRRWGCALAFRAVKIVADGEVRDGRTASVTYSRSVVRLRSGLFRVVGAQVQVLVALHPADARLPPPMLVMTGHATVGRGAPRETTTLAPKVRYDFFAGHGIKALDLLLRNTLNGEVGAGAVPKELQRSTVKGHRGGLFSLISAQVHLSAPLLGPALLIVPKVGLETACYPVPCHAPEARGRLRVAPSFPALARAGRALRRTGDRRLLGAALLAVPCGLSWLVAWLRCLRNLDGIVHVGQSSWKLTMPHRAPNTCKRLGRRHSGAGLRLPAAAGLAHGRSRGRRRFLPCILATGSAVGVGSRKRNFDAGSVAHSKAGTVVVGDRYEGDGDGWLREELARRREQRRGAVRCLGRGSEEGGAGSLPLQA
eukprot:scaffold1465_cov383-Prasinococcus_capsulatus_cf.AAC.11